MFLEAVGGKGPEKSFKSYFLQILCSEQQFPLKAKETQFNVIELLLMFNTMLNVEVNQKLFANKDIPECRVIFH